MKEKAPMGHVEQVEKLPISIAWSKFTTGNHISYRSLERSEDGIADSNVRTIAEIFLKKCANLEG